MFEKEAIRHAIECTIGVECLNKPVEDFTYEELNDEQQEKAYDFQKGAEFGYNKAFVEADKNLKAIITDFNKANEWHRVSDKLPEIDVFVYLRKEDEYFPVVARRHLPYGQKEWVWDCMRGSGFTISQLKGRDYLWKEITLPKEIKEKAREQGLKEGVELGYQKGLKAKINTTTISDCSIKDSWHKQDSDDIYDFIAKDWSLKYFICSMKDKSLVTAIGICDEDYSGGVSTFLDFDHDDRYSSDDIMWWKEIVPPKFEE